MSPVRRARTAALAATLVGAALLLFLTQALPLPREDRTGEGALRAGPASRGPAGLASVEPVASTPPAPPPWGPFLRGTQATVVGRVVDRARKGVAGADVRLRLPDREPVGGVTAGDGSFSLPVGPKPARGLIASVHARSADRAAVHLWSVHGAVADVTDVGTLELAAAEDVAVLVREDGRPARARVLASVGGAGFVSETETDASGRAVLAGLPEGPRRLVAYAPGLRADAEVDVPTRPSPAVLDLLPTRDVRVLVVRQADGTPLEGVRIGVVDRHRPVDASSAFDAVRSPGPTDARGETVLRAVPPEWTLELYVVGDGWTWPSWKTGPEVGPRATEVRIEVPAATSVAFPIVPGATASLADGTAIRLEAPEPNANGWFGSPGDVPRGSAVVREGAVVVEGVVPHVWSAVAVTPDGSVGVLETTRLDGAPRPVTFVAPRVLEVRAVEEGGAPASGVGIALHPPGRSGRARHVRVTDTQGLARFDRLTERKVEVRVAENGTLVESYRVGVFSPPRAVVDLDEGDARLDVVVGRSVDLRVSVRVDGAAAFPAGFGLRAVARPEGLEPVPPPGLVEDPERGEARFRIRPVTVDDPRSSWNGREGLYLHVRARDFADRWVLVESVAGSGSTEVPFSSRGSVALRFRPSNFEFWRFLLQRKDGDGWRTIPVGYDRSGEGDDRVATFRGVGAGTFRVAEIETGATFGPVEIDATRPAAVLVGDLSQMARAEGAVELPNGFSVRDVDVETEGPSLAADVRRRFNTPHLSNVSADGGFRVFLPGDREVTVRARHPSLGFASRLVRAPSEPIVLRFAKPDRLLTLRPVGTSLPRGTLTVRLRPTGDAGGWREVPVRPVNGLASVALAFAVAYDVRVDPGDRAPRTFEGVGADGESLDLGEMSFDRGSTVRLSIPGPARPVLEATATRVGDWPCERAARSHGAPELTLTGLPAGTFRLVAKVPGERAPRLERTIEVDGAEDVPLTIP